ncbi:hypothetical protein DY000_02055856 [Brassica cretica]|uniref:Uncharacterized protein n=1 Tax=Brassica cretica TaxID=69181 RepID=A0ABQ7ABP7_BRACR|nr:hypothetical protein DY000_02055856 [Brassica cretica]
MAMSNVDIIIIIPRSRSAFLFAVLSLFSQHRKRPGPNPESFDVVSFSPVFWICFRICEHQLYPCNDLEKLIGKVLEHDYNEPADGIA